MSSLSGWLIAILVSLGQSNASGTTPTRIAVVNVPVVSEQYLKTGELEREFEERRLKMAEQRDALRDRIDRAVGSLREEFKPGTDEYAGRAKELVMLEAEMQWLVESQGRKIEGQLAASLRLIFDDIRGMIRTMADERGIDVVLAADQLPEGSPSTTAQARQQVVLQKVLFWRPGVDITDDVISRLNTRFQTQRKASPSGSARPPSAEDDSESRIAPKRAVSPPGP